MDPSGKLSSDFRSPLAEGFVAAVETYRGISGTESFFELWATYHDSVKALLLSRPLGAALCRIDPSLLVAAFCADPLWGQKIARDSAPSDLQDELWECGLQKQDGAICTATFTTRNQVVAHQVMHHGEQHVITRCVRTNCCPNCLTHFSTTKSAKQHLNASYSTGMCKIELSHSHWPLTVCQGLSCYHCDLSFSTTEALVAHSRLHLPTPFPAVVPSAALVLHHAGRRRSRRKKTPLQEGPPPQAVLPWRPRSFRWLGPQGLSAL